MSDNEYQKETAIADINRVLSGDFAKPRDLAQAWVNHRWLEDGKTLIFGERLRSLEICDLEKWIIDLIENGRLAAHSQSGIPAQKRQKASLEQGADWQDFLYVNLGQFKVAFDAIKGLEHQTQRIAPTLNKRPGRKPSDAPSLLAKILEALEQFASSHKEPFDRQAMPGPLGGDWQENGSFHWLCAEIHPTFKKAKATFEKHRSGICAISGYAKPTDFYSRALPVIAPKLKVALGVHAEQKRTNKS